MSTTRTITAKKAADVLYRYMRARQFDEIYIEPESRPPIVLDGKADDVYAALIKKKYRAIPLWDPQLVAAWSHHGHQQRALAPDQDLAARCSRLVRPRLLSPYGRLPGLPPSQFWMAWACGGSG